MNGWRNGLAAAMVAALVGRADAQPSPSPTPSASTVHQPAAPARPPVHKIKAVDADNRTEVLNRIGMVSLVIGTNEASQDAAREAGKTLYAIQGRRDFQLIVVVDLRDSIAAWVPSIVLSQMRANLDREALAMKPFYLKNGNKGNPRDASHVIADFKGTICPQLGWQDESDDLRGILFGPDGREIKRWPKLDDFNGMLTDVRAAITALDEADRIKAAAAAAAKVQATKVIQPPSPAPPLPPVTPTPTAPPANSR